MTESEENRVLKSRIRAALNADTCNPEIPWGVIENIFQGKMVTDDWWREVKGINEGIEEK